LDPTEFPPQRGRFVPPVDPKTLIAPSAELAARGKELYEINCIQCHGPLGKGDGPAAGTMNPRPRDFSSPNGWTYGYDLPGIFKTLSEGVQGTSMASFDYMSRRDRMALAHYVQSLGAFPHTGNPQALDALSKELATAGEKTPNRIPVSMAMARMEEEFTAPSPLAIDREDQSPAGKILRQVVINSSRASQVLRESRSWRASARDLAESILAGTPGNGFSVSVAALSPAEWQALHAELLKRIKPE
jgi:mono/diheme cytochrome c family protein